MRNSTRLFRTSNRIFPRSLISRPLIKGNEDSWHEGGFFFQNFQHVVVLMNCSSTPRARKVPTNGDRYGSSLKFSQSRAHHSKIEATYSINAESVSCSRFKSSSSRFYLYFNFRVCVPCLSLCFPGIYCWCLLESHSSSCTKNSKQV